MAAKPYYLKGLGMVRLISCLFLQRIQWWGVVGQAPGGAGKSISGLRRSDPMLFALQRGASCDESRKTVLFPYVIFAHRSSQLILL